MCVVDICSITIHSQLTLIILRMFHLFVADNIFMITLDFLEIYEHQSSSFSTYSANNIMRAVAWFLGLLLWNLEHSEQCNVENSELFVMSCNIYLFILLYWKKNCRIYGEPGFWMRTVFIFHWLHGWSDLSFCLPWVQMQNYYTNVPHNST